MNIIGIGIGIPFSSKVKKTLVKDTFTRADSSATLGNTETGQTWVAVLGTWGISTNQAYCATSTGTNLAYVNAGTANATISAKITYVSNEGLVLRFTDANNHLILRISSSGIGLFRNQAGVTTSIGNYAFTPTVNQIYNVTVKCLGSSINVFINGVLQITATETFNQTATSFGLREVSVNTGRFDDFLVEV